MRTAKLTNKYDQKNRSWNRTSYEDNEYGYNGSYTHKDLGECNVFVNQDSRCNYFLQLEIWHKGFEHTRSFECSCKPSKRLASLKAKKFLNEVLNGNKEKYLEN